MSLAVEEMPASCLLREGEASAEEQLRLAGQLGKALLEENEELRREVGRLRDTIADSHQVRHALSLWTDRRVFAGRRSWQWMQWMGTVYGTALRWHLRSALSHLVQLCEELRCAHGVELARLRSSFESESFELEEELAAVREQLRASERSRREMERRCSKKEEAVVGLEARVRSLEEEIQQVPCGVSLTIN